MSRYLIPLLLLMLLSNVACRAPARHAAGGPFFFESVGNYSVPAQPAGELSTEEQGHFAREGRPYAAVWFDTSGRVLRYELRQQDSVVWVADYRYQGEKLVQSRFQGATGEPIIQNF